jgi:hypothetical protein
LHGPFIDKGLLDWMELPIRRKTFDCLYLRAIGSGCWDEATHHSLTI